MAYNINDVKNIVETLANKQERGRIRPQDFNNACAYVNAQLVSEYLGLPEDYRPGQQVSAWSAEATTVMKMRTYPIRGKQEIVFDATGFAGFPEDHIYPIRMTSVVVLQTQPDVKKRTVNYDILDDGHIGGRLASSISAPSANYPVVEITKDGFQRHPESLGTLAATLVYYRFPRKPVYAFTLSSGREVYDAGNSVQFEWPELSLTQVVSRVLKYMGINFRDADIVGAANQQIQTGK